MHALVIEDDYFTAWFIEEELRDLGYGSVETAATEEKAVAAAARKRPQLITSDGQLGEGNGVDAVRTICSRGVGSIRTSILSSRSRASTRSAACTQST